MITDAGREEISKEELFYLNFDWFIGHVRSLALNAEECCLSQGDFNVAYELFYFLSEYTQLVDDPLTILMQYQKDEVSSFIQGVKRIPENARGWTTIKAESIENMRCSAWDDVRQHAEKLLEVLAPIEALRDDYYARELRRGQL
jgi:hypothetical protein